MKKLADWISDHDNKKWFIIFYIGFSLILSITISLFWLLFAVLIHLAFELIGQSKKKEGTKTIILESLWETKLDFALVVFALWLAVYLDFIFGVAGIGAAARVGAQAASRAGNVAGKATQVSVRFAAWGRVIRAILLSLDDAANAGRAIFQGKKSKARKKLDLNESSQPDHEEETRPNNISSWGFRWSFIDYLSIGLFLICLVLVLLAPTIIGIDYEKVGSVITEEFHPFPK